MADTDERKPTDEQITRPRNSWWTRLVGYVKRKLQQRKAKKEKESSTDRAARRTATATVWMAAFTFILAVISGFTIWILKNQLREMHEGGVDTHTLAEATRDLATAALQQANLSEGEAWKKVGGAWLTVRTIGIYDLRVGVTSPVIDLNIDRNTDARLPTEVVTYVNIDARDSAPNDFPNEKPNSRDGHCIIPATCPVYSLTADTQLSENAYSAFIQGRKKLYVWGYIHYKDIRGSRKVEFWHCISIGDYTGQKVATPGFNYAIPECKPETDKKM